MNPAFVARLPAVSVTRAQAALREAWLLPDGEFARRAHDLLAGFTEQAGADAARLAGRLQRAALVRELAARREAAARVADAESPPPVDVCTPEQLRAGLERLGAAPPIGVRRGDAPVPAGPSRGSGEDDGLRALFTAGQPRPWIVRAIAGLALPARRVAAARSAGDAPAQDCGPRSPPISRAARLTARTTELRSGARLIPSAIRSTMR